MADGSLDQQNGRLSGRHYLLERYAEATLKSFKYFFFYVVSLTIDFQFSNRNISRCLSTQTNCCVRQGLHHALPTPGSEHSKGSLSKRTKRIGRRVLRRQDTPPTLPANSLFYSSKVWISPFPQQLLAFKQFGLNLTHSRSNESTPFRTHQLLARAQSTQSFSAKHCHKMVSCALGYPASASKLCGWAFSYVHSFMIELVIN